MACKIAKRGYEPVTIVVKAFSTFPSGPSSLADVSMNDSEFSFANARAVSVGTCLCSSKSDLLPTNICKTRLDRQREDQSVHTVKKIEAGGDGVNRNNTQRTTRTSSSTEEMSSSNQVAACSNELMLVMSYTVFKGVLGWKSHRVGIAEE